MIGHVHVHRGIVVRVRPMMPSLVLVMVERRVELATVPAPVVRDRHDLATPCPERKLRQQHHARHDLDR